MTVYEEYAQVRKQIETLQSVELQLKNKVIEQINEEGLEKEGKLTDFGTFKLRAVTKWEYSKDYLDEEAVIKAKVKAINEKLKSMKKEEEIKGKAIKVEDSLTLVFTSK